MNDAYMNLLTRRSVKKYTDRQITEEQLSMILEAGKFAPSGSNKQDTVMVVLQDPELIAEYEVLNGTCIGRPRGSFYGAPTVVIVLANKQNSNRQYDGALVMGNLMNAAHAIGVDSCWINRAREAFETEEGKALLKRFGLEGEYEGVGNCILGFCDGEPPKAAPRKENRIFRF